MAVGELRTVIRHIRKVLALTDTAALTDAELVDRFARHGEEAAFEAIMRRYGPLVFGVCRRILRELHDAEDAYQATFLVLARKASTLRKPELLGGWLYGVAYRVAQKANANASRRRQSQGPLSDTPAPVEEDSLVRIETRQVLDEELSRLPEKYRAPLVLCYLQGKTKEQAAQELGWPEGTVSGRLARGRELLRPRLTRRGWMLSAGLLGGMVSHRIVSATVPERLVHSTANAALLNGAGTISGTGSITIGAATLARGVMRAMVLNKLKVAAAVLLVAAGLTLGMGFLTHYALAGKQGPERQAVVSEQPTMKKASTPSPFTATLTEGITVELVGVAHNNDRLRNRAKTWWRPDGMPLPTAPYSSPCTYSNEANPYEFAFRLSDAERLSFRAEAPAGKSTSEAQVPQDEGRKALPSLRAVVIARFAAEDIETSVRVAVASGPWTKVEVWQDYPWEELQGTNFINAAQIVFSWPRQEGDTIVAEITHTYLNEATRLVAFDRQGKLYQSAEHSGGDGKGLTRRHCIFSGLKLKDVQRFEFQTRPYLDCVTFRSISLQPGHKTEVRMDVEKPRGTESKGAAK